MSSDRSSLNAIESRVLGTRFEICKWKGLGVQSSQGEQRATCLRKGSIAFYLVGDVCGCEWGGVCGVDHAPGPRGDSADKEKTNIYREREKRRTESVKKKEVATHLFTLPLESGSSSSFGKACSS